MFNLKFSKINLLLIYIVLCESIILKTVMYKILPDKYFYDGLHIIELIQSDIIVDKSYTFAANFFKYINFWGLTTLQGWSYFLTPIFMLLVLIIISKNKKYSLSNIVFIIASIGFLNIYVFGISKDIIQFLFFLIIYIILKSKLNNVKKIFLICIVLLFEAFNFRIYYAIMSMLIVTIYIIYNLFINKKKIKKIEIVKIFILSTLAFFVEVFIVSILSPSNYNSIIYARSSVNLSRESTVDAVTMINDLLGLNANFITFMGNYVINLVRILIPIELFFKGIKYIPFIVYQLYITYNLFISLKKINSINILWIITALSYLMIATIFEPDFGSFIRHESAMFLIIQYIIFNINNEKNISRHLRSNNIY